MGAAPGPCPNGFHTRCEAFLPVIHRATLTSPHVGLPKLRPDFRAAFAAGVADKARLDIRQSYMIRPLVGADLDVMAVAMIAAIDQDVADAGRAQFAEGDFLWVGRHGQLTRRQLKS